MRIPTHEKAESELTFLRQALTRDMDVLTKLPPKQLESLLNAFRLERVMARGQMLVAANTVCAPRLAPWQTSMT